MRSSIPAAERTRRRPVDKRPGSQASGPARGRQGGFVDVALMTPVPGRGLRTPSFASGPGAERYAAAMRPLGVPVEVVGERAGDASTRKLLRSVTMKGLAALVIEALRGRAGRSCAVAVGRSRRRDGAADARLLERLLPRDRSPRRAPRPRDGSVRRPAVVTRRRTGDDPRHGRIPTPGSAPRSAGRPGRPSTDDVVELRRTHVVLATRHDPRKSWHPEVPDLGRNSSSDVEREEHGLQLLGDSRLNLDDCAERVIGWGRHHHVPGHPGGAAVRADLYDADEDGVLILLELDRLASPSPVSPYSRSG